MWDVGAPLVALLALAGALAFAASAAAAPAEFVHAHRGGPLKTVKGKQKPAMPEETLATFRKSAKAGFVLEVDVKLTADRSPVVLHDATLDRTTNCDGRVADITLADLRADCVVDLLGTAETTRQMGPNNRRRRPVPKLGQVLRLAKKHKATVNLEVKNLPTDPDYDPTPFYAHRVLARIKRSKFPARKIIFQNFIPANFEPFQADPYFKRSRYSYLSLNVTNDAVLEAADAAGADFISPQWPISSEYVQRAHNRGLEVVPWTLNDRGDLRDAIATGVDAVITDDPRLARRLSR